MIRSASRPNPTRTAAAVALAAITLFPAALGAQGDESARGALAITYLGNEGFLLESGGKKVLIDALVSPVAKRYVVQTEDLRKDLHAAASPFDGVGLVLATHHHADHFEAAAVGRHLETNPKAVFVSTVQAINTLSQSFAGYDALSDRVETATPEEGKRQAFPKLGLTTLNLHHGRERRPPVANLGFLVDVGGWKVLHVGDTEATAEDFAAYALPEEEIDVAFVPSWILSHPPWQGVVDEQIGARWVVPMHLVPFWSANNPDAGQKQTQDWVAAIEAARPDVVVFRKLRETRSLDP